MTSPSLSHYKMLGSLALLPHCLTDILDVLLHLSPYCIAQSSPINQNSMLRRPEKGTLPGFYKRPAKYMNLDSSLIASTANHLPNFLWLVWISKDRCLQLMWFTSFFFPSTAFFFCCIINGQETTIQD